MGNCIGYMIYQKQYVDLCIWMIMDVFKNEWAPIDGLRANLSHPKTKLKLVCFFGLVVAKSPVCFFFPESVWAKGSSNSGALLYIFICSHLHNLTCSHTHIFTSSRLHIFTLSPSFSLFSSSRLLIFTSSHLHIFTLSLSFFLSLLIFTSSHLHVFSSSRLLIFTSSSHLHHTFITSSHLHHTFITSSHLHIFITSSHLHIFTSHLHSFTSPLLLSSFSLSPSLSPSLSLSPLALCHGLSPSFSLLSVGRGRCRRGATKWPPFRTKWGSPIKNWCKIAILGATLSLETRFECQKLIVFLRVGLVRRQPFRTKWGWVSKTQVKLRFYILCVTAFACKRVCRSVGV